MEYFHLVQSALEMVLRGIQPFIEEVLQNVYGSEYWVYMEGGLVGCKPGAMDNKISDQMKDFSYSSVNANKKYKDVLFYVNAMIKNWEIFRGLFPTGYALCLCYNIKYFRNKWAHQSPFTTRELYRFFDECQALLEEIKADVGEIDGIRKAVMEMYYNEEVSKALNLNTGNSQNVISSNPNLVLPSPINYPPSNGSSLPSNVPNSVSNSLPNSVPNSIHSSINCQSLTYNNLHIADENLTMVDADELDKNLLHSNNYEKLMDKNQNESNSHSMYKITYYEEEEEESTTKKEG